MADTPVLDLLASMTADSIEASSLDPETLVLVRIAALVAVDAAPMSYVANLEVVSDLEIDAGSGSRRARRSRSDRRDGTHRLGARQDRRCARLSSSRPRRSTAEVEEGA